MRNFSHGGMGMLAISNLAGLQSAITNLVQGPANDLNNARGLSNLLAGEAVFPEFVQEAATGKKLADAALELLH